MLVFLLSFVLGSEDRHVPTFWLLWQGLAALKDIGHSQLQADIRGLNINIRILQSGSQAQDKEQPRNHGFL